MNADVPWAMAGPSGADPAGPALQPRRLELGQLHHQPARQRRGDGCAGAGADPRRGGGAPQLPGRLPDPAANRRGPAHREQRMGRRPRRGAARTKPRSSSAPAAAHETAKARGVDAKLARGSALTRPYAVCTVTVPKTARIAEYGRRLDAAVRRAGFAPLRLDLAHDVGVRRLHRPPRRQPDPPRRRMTGRHPRPQARPANARHRRSGRDPAARRLRPRPARRTVTAATEAKEARLFQLRPPSAAAGAAAAAGRPRRRRCRRGG